MFVCLCVLCCGIVVVCGVFVFFNKPLETHVLHANGKTGGQRYVLNSNAKMYPKFFSFFQKFFIFYRLHINKNSFLVESNLTLWDECVAVIKSSFLL